MLGVHVTIGGFDPLGFCNPDHADQHQRFALGTVEDDGGHLLKLSDVGLNVRHIESLPRNRD